MDKMTWPKFFAVIALVTGVMLGYTWFSFESSISENSETAANFKQKMVRTTGSFTEGWEYVDTDGVSHKTRDCGTEDWTLRRCAETEDGLVTFHYGTSKSGNIYRPFLTVDGKERLLTCVTLGSAFEQRHHCGL